MSKILLFNLQRKYIKILILRMLLILLMPSQRKFLIVNLASMDEVYKNCTLKDISRTYSALSKWDVLYNNKWDLGEKSKFKNLVIKMQDQIFTIAKEQDVQSDIRFASAEIVDELEDKSNLRGKFDQGLIKILNKLSDVEYTSEISTEITKLIESGIIQDANTLNKSLDGLKRSHCQQ